MKVLGNIKVTKYNIGGKILRLFKLLKFSEVRNKKLFLLRGFKHSYINISPEKVEWRDPIILIKYLLRKIIKNIWGRKIESRHETIGVYLWIKPMYELKKYLWFLIIIRKSITESFSEIPVTPFWFTSQIFLIIIHTIVGIRIRESMSKISVVPLWINQAIS